MNQRQTIRLGGSAVVIAGYLMLAGVVSAGEKIDLSEKPAATDKSGPAGKVAGPGSSVPDTSGFEKRIEQMGTRFGGVGTVPSGSKLPQLAPPPPRTKKEDDAQKNWLSPKPAEDKIDYEKALGVTLGRSDDSAKSANPRAFVIPKDSPASPQKADASLGSQDQNFTSPRDFTRPQNMFEPSSLSGGFRSGSPVLGSRLGSDSSSSGSVTPNSVPSSLGSTLRDRDEPRTTSLDQLLNRNSSEIGSAPRNESRLDSILRSYSSPSLASQETAPKPTASALKERQNLDALVNRPSIEQPSTVRKQTTIEQTPRQERYAPAVLQIPKRPFAF